MELNEKQITELSHVAAIGMINSNTSNKYKYVDSFDVLESLELTGAEIDSIKFNRHGKSSKHLIDIRLKETIQVFGDSVIPRLLLVNSYNGECAFSIRVGVFRLVCSNGLIVGTETFHQRLVHLDTLDFDDKLKTIQEAANDALKYMRMSMANEIVEKMGKYLTPDKQHDVVDGLGLSKRIIKSIHSKLECPRLEDSSNTTWSLYNIINEAIREASRSPLRNEEKNFDLMSKVVKLAA